MFGSKYVTLDHHTSGKPYATLRYGFSYTDKQGKTHRASSGMITDGLTVPRFFWRVIGAPMLNRFLPAAIIHDHYCWKAQTLEGEDRKSLRRNGDKLFKEICRRLGAGRIRAWILYKAVRAGSNLSQRKKPIPDYQHEPELFMLYWKNTRRNDASDGQTD